jgi:predicted dehydrogenase
VFVAENYVYKPLAFRLREIIRSGDLGQVRFLQVNALKEQHAAGWRGDIDLAGGGALFEGGIHWVSLMGSLGLDVAGIWGAQSGAIPGVDRSALVVFIYKGGPVGTLHFSWEIRAPLRGVRISRIYGTEGSVLFESNGLFLLQQRWAPPRRSLPRFGSPGIRDLLGYRAMFADFFRSLRTGTPPLYTLNAAGRDLERMEKIYRVMGRQTAENPRDTSWRSQ